MDSAQGIVLVAVLTLFAGLVLGYIFGRGRELARQNEERAAARDEASQILARARAEAETIQKDGELRGREEAFRIREDWKREEGRRREEIERAERRVNVRSDAFDRKFETIKEREGALDGRAAALDGRERTIEETRTEVDRTLGAVRQRLEELSGLTAAEAKEELVAGLRGEAEAEAAQKIRQVREETQRTARREARKIVSMAIQRMAAEATQQATVSVVQLPSDDMKGRIIGREGRNIRAFEQMTGIDVIIDDTPEAVVLSGFDPVRREIARIALDRLVEDGRIHPGRIEEVVAKSREDVEEGMLEAAEQVLYDLGIHKIHPEIVRVLGNLKFRTSYGQNQLQHSREVAMLAGAMAAEMGLNSGLAKRAGLLHDVGKGMTHDHEGTHVELGYELCRKHHEPDLVLNAIKAHHDEEPHRYPEAFLVTAADAISGARPGARRETLDTYVKRLERLEEIAMDFPGVERCFAVQAGREVRVMVQPEKVPDGEMAELSGRVARRLEDELQYPGQIKVVVIRETRAIDFAR